VTESYKGLEVGNKALAKRLGVALGHSRPQGAIGEPALKVLVDMVARTPTQHPACQQDVAAQCRRLHVGLEVDRVDHAVLAHAQALVNGVQVVQQLHSDGLAEELAALRVLEEETAVGNVLLLARLEEEVEQDELFLSDLELQRGVHGCVGARPNTTGWGRVENARLVP
jgi:hypothetical protein